MNEGNDCKRMQAVEVRNPVGVELHRADVVGQPLDQIIEKPALKDQDLFLCSEDLLFIFLQLFSNIALGTHQGLLAAPVIRHPPL